MKGKKVASGTNLIVCPASREIYLEALKKGLVRIFAEAGATVLPPGYGVNGDHPGRHLAKDERCLTTGCPGLLPEGHESEIYVASPATAAATALSGSICEPAHYL
jgi:3-isopropylmalate/(R)-2-methylmalate dehydratase large subunit